MERGELLLAGCGILRQEVGLIVARRGWAIETRWLDSSLHCELDRLARGLEGTLKKTAGRERIVFYGACHPLMDRMLSEAGTFRTAGQNCVEMLLGRERFQAEAEAGAYFLLEDWARRWDEMMTRTFGPKREIAREIFRGDRTNILAIRTPCSGDFTAAAEKAATEMEVPLRWTDVGLEHLERVLEEVIERQRASRTKMEPGASAGEAGRGDPIPS